MRERTEVTRLRAMLKQDKSNTPTKFDEVVKSDIYAVLRNYFELSGENLVVQLHNENHQIFIEILAKAEAVKRLGGINR